MPSVLKTIVRDYGSIHLSLGLVGNVSFLAGSFLFLPAFETWKTTGVWLFIIGASLMTIGALGRLLVSFYD